MTNVHVIYGAFHGVRFGYYQTKYHDELSSYSFRYLVTSKQVFLQGQITQDGAWAWGNYTGGDTPGVFRLIRVYRMLFRVGMLLLFRQS